MTANRDQHYWHAVTPPEWQNSDSPYELVTLVHVLFARMLPSNIGGPVASINHVVSAHEEAARNNEPKRLGGVEVDHQLEICGLLDPQSGRVDCRHRSPTAGTSRAC
jgi:hypothetical protein